MELTGLNDIEIELNASQKTNYTQNNERVYISRESTSHVKNNIKMLSILKLMVQSATETTTIDKDVGIAADYSKLIGSQKLTKKL